MTDLKPGWQRVKFGELANCINARVEDPSKADVDAGGSRDDVESTKLRFNPSDIILGKRRAYQCKLAVADIEGSCSAHAMVLRVAEATASPRPGDLRQGLWIREAVLLMVGGLHHATVQTIRSGRTRASKSSPLRWPSPSAASRRLRPWWWACSATAAARS